MLKWRKTADLDATTVTKHWATYGILGTVIITMAFFGVCSPRNNMGGLVLPTGTAAKVAGEKISSTDFRRAYVNYSNQLQQQYKDKFDPVALNVAPQVLNGLIEREAVYQEATKNGVSASEEEVVHVITDGKYFHGENGKFDPTLFQRYLQSQGHSEKSFTDELRHNIVQTKFRNLVTSTYRTSSKVAELNYLLDESKADVEYLRLDPNTIPVTVPAADVDKYLAGADAKKVKDYYDQNKAEFNQDAKVKARHILISFKGARNATGAAANRSKDEAKAIATKLLAEVKKPGADFAAIASKNTDEPSGKAKGGDLGYFKKDQMVKEFADVAFSMKPGQVSEPVESAFGFHIIKVEDVQAAKSVSFDEAKRGIAEKLIAKDRRPQIIAEKTKTLLDGLKAGKDESSSLGLSWKDTGPFAVGARFVPGLGADKKVMGAIASLKKPGEVYPEALDVTGAKIILRLKSRQDADLSKLTDDKRKELVESSKYMEGYTLFGALAKDINDRYEKSGKIYRNPEFLSYDTTVHGNKGAGGSAPASEED